MARLSRPLPTPHAWTTGICAGAFALLAARAGRLSWGEVRLGGATAHELASTATFGAALGAVVIATAAIGAELRARLARRPRLALVATIVVYAAPLGACMRAVRLSPLDSRALAGRLPLALLLPVFFLAALALAALARAIEAWAGRVSATPGRARILAFCGAVCLGGGLAVSAATVHLPGSLARLRVALELAAATVWGGALALCLARAWARSTVARGVCWSAALGLGGALVLSARGRAPMPARESADEWATAAPSAAPLPPGAVPPVKNVLVFFVDALRADVARDERVMPNVAALARQSLVFTRAYAAGSDTLRALPALLACRYDADPRARAPMLDAVARAGRRSVLFIPSSPAEFLSALYPGFAFDEVRTVADYDRDRRSVWAYGADRPTAALLADESLRWIAQHSDAPFFAWMYHFDVHSWGDIDESYVRSVAKDTGLDDAGDVPLRYKVAARGVDHALGRVVDGLRALGLADTTAIVVVSDHGEALGRQGFWLHTTHLWESLVRVPWIVRVPGLRPQVIDDPVSLVDLWPTLRDALGAPTRPCHGHDALAPSAAPRARPILFAAVADGEPSRFGLVEGARKLVVKVPEGSSDLHDLDASDPDATSLARAEPETLERMRAALFRSPLVPRSPVTRR